MSIMKSNTSNYIKCYQYTVINVKTESANCKNMPPIVQPKQMANIEITTGQRTREKTDTSGLSAIEPSFFYWTCGQEYSDKALKTPYK